ncbi:hypothetical protein NC797_10225 [Aquibacillus sp. 3ASR75-11]|uniref:KTSC domain-containing protein n=1 Tax=Terrihalobacillus insolitus TaxID=2950438 RepID=A0A9X4ANU9_9BACI|nr:hypothetical protein [Terrihalobacillus insolitus]MDC3413302.1 hypothetical protein [Terrihalobacillus insolitus]MDC3424885.1 hypothetical protein [Terrihalobacillus insolitus]
MKFTMFDQQMWGNLSFEKIGYDKNNRVFIIYLLNGQQLEFSGMDERTVFQFIIAQDKEIFIQNFLLPNYKYIQREAEVS